MSILLENGAHSIEHDCVQQDRLVNIESKFSVMWSQLDNFVTIKIFGLFMATFMSVFIASMSFLYHIAEQNHSIIIDTHYEVTQLRIKAETEAEAQILRLKAEHGEATIRALRFKHRMQEIQDKANETK